MKRAMNTARLLVSLGAIAIVGCSDNTLDIDRSLAPLITAPSDDAVDARYIVVLHDAVATAEVEALIDAAIEADPANRLEHTYEVIHGFNAYLSEETVDELRADPRVAYIEQDSTVTADIVYPSPADGLDRVDQRQGRDGFYNDYSREGEGVHVYVLDTGINSTHREFGWRIGGGMTVISDGMGVEDCHGHGTHVSSTVGGREFGMAKLVTIHPVRVLGCNGSGTWGGVIAGIDFVRNDCPTQAGPCVANMSLGGSVSPSVNAAVANAVDSGVPFVVAAGNNNADACTKSPASEPKAITVAAIDDADKRAYFSNFGNCVDLFAPGVSILGAWIGSVDASNSISGTSMASPHVAGAVAQVLGTAPNLTPAQAQSALMASASLECVSDAKGSPNVLLFNDFSQGNYTCAAAEASCEGLCGGPGDGCFCDELCMQFGDCCPDYEQVCN